ncbi:MYO15A [Bugula neritina]|uniref:MYO15A n=1 Tax=Bugula neritina TaxID=10212 RepID=A0A7J7JWT7_BUGNE|nr:MYO15A [Bugula neritina]
MSLIPKTYNFSEPIPEPFVHEIFTTEEYEKDEETSQVVEKEEEDSPAPVEKETTWLIRGELSTVTAVENLIYLSDLTEKSILLNLRIRYQANLIYTYIGSILITINPYRQLPIYTDKHIRRYDGQVLGSLNPPYDYPLKKLLIATPLLESFGNAKTIRNNNSSRFGKYLELVYDGIEDRTDSEDFQVTLASLDVLGFSSEDKSCVFEILAAILHIGNIRYSAPRQALKGEIVSVPLSAQVAINTRDAIARALYTQLFMWLVHRVNKAINPTLHQLKSIALLDIFGFESFRLNGFEQLCINYANEHLQRLFNRAVFEAEQELYEREGIEWTVLKYDCNETVLDLLSLRPHGILRMLDDEAQFPKLCISYIKVVLNAVKVIENKVKTLLLRRRFLKQRAAVIRLQSYWKSYFHRKRYQQFKANIAQCQANLRCRWQRHHFLKYKQQLIIERDRSVQEHFVGSINLSHHCRMDTTNKELTREELKTIIGLEIPPDLAFLYHMENGLPALHMDEQITTLSTKIFTQTTGLKVPRDINNFIFTNFAELYFQQHHFIAKREPINHPF